MATSVPISGLVALGAAPASNDLLPIVDVSSTVQAPTGSTVKVTVAELFTSVTVTTSLTVTGTATISSTLNVAGNFSVATNKLTVAAASGNTVVAGTLGVTGAVTLNKVSGALVANAGATTGNVRYELANTSGAMYWGVESSAGGGIFGGSTAYAGVLGTAVSQPLQFFTNSTLALTISTAQAVTLASSLAITGALSGVTTLAASGAITSTEGSIAVKWVATASGTYGSGVQQRWYRADGTTLRAVIGYNAADTQLFQVGTAEVGGITLIKSGNNTTAITVGSAQDVTLASSLAITGALTGATTVAASSTITGSKLLATGANTAGGFSHTDGAVTLVAYATSVGGAATFGTTSAHDLTFVDRGASVGGLYTSGLYGGLPVTGAVAKIVASDGTAPANNAYTPANVSEMLVSEISSSTSASKVTVEAHHQHTGALTGSWITHFAYMDAAHTSGTSDILIASTASVQATGNGGTTTTLGCYRTQAVIGTGHTVTTLALSDIRSPSNSGTIINLVGLDVQAMTAGGTLNYAIRTRANCSLFNGSGSAIATNATVGFVHLPNMAGTPTGVPANLVTGASPCCIDTTAGKFWSYYGAAWHFVTLT